MRLSVIVGIAVVGVFVAYMADQNQSSTPRLTAASTPVVALVSKPPNIPSPKLPPLSNSEVKGFISKVKTRWRAQDGESAEQILAKVSRVAHFIHRGWDVAQSDDDGSRSVVFSWARKRTDKEGDEYTIEWKIKPDGGTLLDTPYAQLMELGWQAFALSLIQSEVDDDAPGPNRRFLHDLSNVNFVETPQGKLGDLLKRGRCKLGDPVGVDYVRKLRPDKDGDFFRLQLSVDCNIAGPRYFTHDGLILFQKRGSGPWQPFSFFAHRIARYTPGFWFDRPDPGEQEAFEAAKQAFERAGLPVSGSPFPK